jgi:hypothetical protein
MILSDPFAAPSAEVTNATHRESKRVVLRGTEGNRTLQTFCLGADGKIFGVVAKSPYDVAASDAGGEIRVLAADGTEQASWKLAFTPQRIAAAPDGPIYVGGSGKLARIVDGKQDLTVDSPHAAAVLADKESLRKAAEEQRATVLQQYEAQLKEFDEQIRALEEQQKTKTKTDEPKEEAAAPQPTTTSRFSLFSLFGGGTTVAAAPPSNEQQLRQYRQMKKSYEQMIARQKERTIEDVESDILARLNRIHGIAVGADAVYVATAVTKGYGYAVWRMTRDFTDAKQIVTGLSGCCGQIDVQARGDELFVAENSRHRVVRYDRDGKRLDAWGQRDREGLAGGFGGCCNPMNLCFTGDGMVVTSESEGVMKLFSPDGKYSGVLGNAKVGGGCKNVAVGVAPDGKYAYFYDQQGSQIIIFERSDSAAEPKKATVEKQASVN